MRPNQIALLLLASTMMFGVLLIVFAGHFVRYILAAAPVFVSVYASCMIYDEYHARTTRAVAEDEDEEDVAAARKITHMDIVRWIFCATMVLVAFLDTLRIALRWRAMPGMTFGTVFTSFFVFITIVVDEVGACLGF